MTKWTYEQSQAIFKSGSNLIVSAGAGSGKTAVLSERVLEKIKSGIHINELLVLTFTSAAASEMKNRIKKKLSNDTKYKNELNLLNSSYITTFDSFALSIVKKYHYLLGLSSNIKITDESLVIIKEKEILNDIFENKYKSEDIKFQNLIKKYCIKNDNYLREIIFNICNTINNYIDYSEYINFIENTFFTDEYIEKLLKEYEEIINNKKKIIKFELSKMEEYYDYDFMNNMYELLDNLLNSNAYDLNMYGNITLPRSPRGTLDEGKN